MRGPASRSDRARWPTVALLWLLLARGGWAQGLSMDATLSIGTTYKMDHCVPMTVTLRNAGAAFDGRLEVEMQTQGGMPAGWESVLVRQPVSLPTNANRQIVLRLPPPQSVGFYNPELVVRLMGDGPYPVVPERKVPLRQLYSGDFVIVAVSRSRASFSYLSSLKARSGSMSQMEVESPDPETLPTHWAGYGTADLVVLSGVGSLNLTADQEKALVDWVHAGGTLLLVSNLDPGEFNRSQLKTLLPVRPEASVEVGDVPQAATSDFKSPHETVLRSTAIDGVALESLSNDVPLLVAAGRGQGQVIFCCANLANPANLSNALSDRLWKSAVRTAQQRGARLLVDDPHLLEKPPEVSPPSFGFLALFLLAYIILVGPVNFYVLRRMDRMLLTYLTVPVLAMVFTFTSFLMSYSSKGARVVLRDVSVRYLEGNDDPTAYTHSYVSLFSPNRSSYNVQFPDSSMARMLETQGVRQHQPLVLEFGNGMVFRDVRVEMWTLQRFEADSVVTYPGGVRVVATLDRGPSPRVKGWASNHTGQVFSQCVLFQDGYVSPVFTLDPGKTPLDAGLQGPYRDPRALKEALGTLFHLTPQSTEGLDPARATVLGKVSDELIQKAFAGPVILAWSDQAGSGVHVDRSTVRDMHQMLTIIR